MDSDLEQLEKFLTREYESRLSEILEDQVRFLDTLVDAWVNVAKCGYIHASVLKSIEE